MVYRQAEALRILYEKYLELRGHNLETICQQCKIEIQHWLPYTKDGRVFKISGDLIIVLPSKPSSPEIEQIIGFHELAHAFIFDSHWVHLNSIEKKIVEAWCDNFSLAMILELYKIRPVGIDDYETFFRQGEGLERLEESDLFLSKKIFSHFNESTVNLEPGCHPLIDLGRELLIMDD